jgi:hypothetical protein
VEVLIDYFIDYFRRVANNNDWWIIGVELVVIGLAVYWIVDFLEGTRGERLFRGVILMILILVMGLLILNLLFQQF